MANILQWNCEGYNTHKAELQLIIAKHNPSYICLQETNFKTSSKASLINYNEHRNDRTTCHRASGGVAILVKNDKHAETIPLNTELEAVAVQTFTPDQLTICCLYIPPNHDLTETEIINIQNQLPKPYVICGDFNAHNIAWGSETTNKRGEATEALLDAGCILNDGSPTHFCKRTGTFSIIDLTFANPEIFYKLTWQTLPHLYGSDHFPIMINYTSNNQQTEQITHSKKKWNLNQANWNKYKELLKDKLHNFEITPADNATTLITKISEHIISTAEDTIGYQKQNDKQKNVPWWNTKCYQTIKEAKKALNKYKKNKTTENLIELKRTKAIARRTILESKKQSWKKFVNTLNKDTPLADVWKTIRKINGLKQIHNIPMLIDGTDKITSPKEIANKLAETFYSNSSNEVYTKNFQETKKKN